MRYPKYLPLVAMLLCAGAPLTFADQVVYFVNGKAIMVKSVEKGEKFTILEMDGGGRIGVPTDQISKIEAYAISEPVAAPAAPPQVAAVPALPAPARAAGPSPSLTPQSMSPGPGIGGRPVPGAGQGIAGIPPLEIGGSGPPAAGQRSPARLGVDNRGLGAPMMARPGAGRPDFAAGRRPGGRGGMYGNARGIGRLSEVNPGPPLPGTPAAAQPGAGTPPGAPPVAPPPAAASEPEEASPPPDDADEESYDPSAPEANDSSGSTPGGTS